MNPLNQLADINPPEHVAMWPLAWGYWLAIVLTLLALGVSIHAFKLYRAKRKMKRAALATLSELNVESDHFVHKVQIIMKSLCAHHLPSVGSQQLHSDSWQELVLSIYRGKDSEVLAAVLVSLHQGLYHHQEKNKEETRAQNLLIKNTVQDWIKSSFPCESSSIAQINKTHKVTKPTNEVSHV